MALVAGNIVDRSNKNRLVIIALSGLGLSALISWLYMLNADTLFPIYGVWPLYLAMVVNGLSRAFLGPCTFSIVTKIMPKSLYLSASPIDTSSWQIAAVTGPAMGGILYGIIGSANTMLLSVMFYLLAIAMLALIKIRVNGDKSKRLFDREEFFKGVKFIFNNKMILSAMSLDMFAVLFGGAIALLPVVAKDILQVGSSGLGILRAAPAIGSGLMGLLLTTLPPIKRGGRLMVFCIIGFGLATVVFGLSTNFYLSWLMLFLTGAFDNISVIVRSTVLQMFTPEELRGRTSSVRSMFIISSNEIGAFESGLTAQLMGTTSAIVFGGVMSILIAVIALRKARELMALDFDKLGQS
jgi:MFS family permease